MDAGRQQTIVSPDSRPGRLCLAAPRGSGHEPTRTHSMSLTRSAIIDRIRAIEEPIRQLGVGRMAIFGSSARDEATADSDVDVLVEFRPGRKSFCNFLALATLLEQTLDRQVDLVTVEGLSPHIGPRIQAEAIDVLRAA